MKITSSTLLTLCLAVAAHAETAWQTHVGKPGMSGWRAHVIQPDPKDAGPDGINLHDWDGDGDLDLFVNYEEGRYSRLYFNPGNKKIHALWTDFIQFKHGKCEDSGIGDLDDDGDIDYIANGGWVYFNPGKRSVRDPSKWTKMTLFDNEARVPTVTDIDGDGLNDLVVGARAWYRQPVKDKHDARAWKKYAFGSKAIWPMSCILHDLDHDGDQDLVVQDRRAEVFWFVNPGKDKVTGNWPRRQIHSGKDFMFMTLGDANADKLDDLVLAGGRSRKSITVLLRTNATDAPKFKEVVIRQPATSDGKSSGDNFPKGVAIMELDGDTAHPEIVVVPKMGDVWYATVRDDATDTAGWQVKTLDTPGANTRKKMDNAFLGDLDGDGDQDILTTEENGGWGVVWFENPGVKEVSAGGALPAKTLSGH